MHFQLIKSLQMPTVNKMGHWPCVDSLIRYIQGQLDLET